MEPGDWPILFFLALIVMLALLAVLCGTEFPRKRT